MGRVVVPALDAMVGKTLDVLDHGFVRLVDYMGDDAAVVQAARVSYGAGTKAVREDTGLIRYLMRHRHTTPFEMCELKVHVKAPIFVARQWFRHRTGSFNEYSARYSKVEMEDNYYVPEDGALGAQSASNKQGRDVGGFGMEAADFVRSAIGESSNESYLAYQDLLEPEDEYHPPLSRELGRIVLPVNFYTQWYWKVDLHNLLHFLSLRVDSHAQYEIRMYAETIMEKIVKPWVPITYQAFMDYVVGGVRFSAGALSVARRMVSGDDVGQSESGLTPREWRDVREALGVTDET